MGSIAPSSLDALGRYVERRLGLDFSDRREKDLVRGITQAAEAFGRGGVESFVRWLLSGGASQSDLERLASHLTIGETYFFRDKRAFSALEKIILPELIRKRREVKRLRIWCAGCSSGEEPYSIAILLRRLVPDFREWSIDITGTDINLTSLRKATLGEYTRWSFRDCDIAGLAPHVVPARQGTYRVSDSLRSSVRLSYLNLVEDSFPSLTNNTVGKDLIICRNVLMYFRPERGSEVAGRLLDCLSDDGYMLLGPAELHLLSGPRIESLSLEGSTCFRRAPANRPAGRESFVWTPTERALDEPLAKESKVVGLPMPPVTRRRKSRSCDEGPGRYRRSAPVSSRSAADESPAAAGDSDARRLANLGRLDEALGACDRALLTDKTNSDVHYLRATICFELGRPAESSDSLRKALYLSPDFIAAHFTAGLVARALGKTREANRHFNQARNLLADKAPDWEVPGADGMLAGRLSESLSQLLDLGETA